MRWKLLGRLLVFVVIAVVGYHYDPVGTTLGLVVVVPLSVGLSVWQAIKFTRETPARKTELMAAAKARHAARQG